MDEFGDEFLCDVLVIYVVVGYLCWGGGVVCWDVGVGMGVV